MLGKGEELPHHQQQNVCTTRPAYRQGRRLTAVKVYSIISESTHLMIKGVPDLKLFEELLTHVRKYGNIVQMKQLPLHAAELFTTTYHVQYDRLLSARFAKKGLDDTSFYGGILHVCYAPEFETSTEISQKLKQRKKDVIDHLKRLRNGSSTANRNAARRNRRSYEQAFPSTTMSTSSQQSPTLPGTAPNMPVVRTIRTVVHIHRDRFGQSSVASVSVLPRTEEVGPNELSLLTDEIRSIPSLPQVDRIEALPEQVIHEVGHSALSLQVAVEEELNRTRENGRIATENIRQIPTERLNQIIFHINRNN